MFSHNARFIKGDPQPQSAGSVTGYPQRGGAYVVEGSRASFQQEVRSLAASADGEAGVGLNPGSYSGDMHLVEWKSSQATRMTQGTTKLQHQMVGAVSSYSFQWTEFAHMLVSIWSPYPSVQICGFL